MQTIAQLPKPSTSKFVKVHRDESQRLSQLSSHAYKLWTSLASSDAAMMPGVLMMGRSDLVPIAATILGRSRRTAYNILSELITARLLVCDRRMSVMPTVLINRPSHKPGVVRKWLWAATNQLPKCPAQQMVITILRTSLHGGVQPVAQSVQPIARDRRNPQSFRAQNPIESKRIKLRETSQQSQPSHSDTCTLAQAVSEGIVPISYLNALRGILDMTG